MASLALSFGSLGDIIAVVQLVAHLHDALNGVIGAPAAINAIAHRLQLYTDILAEIEKVLRGPESSLGTKTRAGIEDQLKGCNDTLLALTERVTVYTAQLRQPRMNGPRRPILLFILGAPWQYVHGRKVAGLRVRLDEHFSTLRDYLTISQCKGQEALLALVKDNRLSTTRIMSVIDKRPPHIVVGASAMQVYDWESETYYQAFAVVPVRMLAAYVEPILSLIETCTPSLAGFEVFERTCVSGRSVSETIALLLRRGLPPYPMSAIGLHCESAYSIHRAPTIFDFTIFSPESGEPHALLGVPPILQTDLSSRVLSDILQGDLRDQVNAGMYEGEIRKARYIQSTLATYNLLILMAMPSLPSKWNTIDSLLLCCFLSFPDPEFLKASDKIRDLEAAFSRCSHLSWNHPDVHDNLFQLVEVLQCAPRISEAIISTVELSLVTAKVRALLTNSSLSILPP